MCRVEPAGGRWRLEWVESVRADGTGSRGLARGRKYFWLGARRFRQARVNRPKPKSGGGGGDVAARGGSWGVAFVGAEFKRHPLLGILRQSDRGQRHGRSQGGGGGGAVMAGWGEAGSCGYDPSKAHLAPWSQRLDAAQCYQRPVAARIMIVPLSHREPMLLLGRCLVRASQEQASVIQ
jgi:hypothetical protein